MKVPALSSLLLALACACAKSDRPYFTREQIALMSDAQLDRLADLYATKSSGEIDPRAFPTWQLVEAEKHRRIEAENDLLKAQIQQLRGTRTR